MNMKSDVKIQHPKRLSTNKTDEGLITIMIKIRHRKITVCEASAFDGHRRGLILGELYDEFDALDEKSKDDGKLWAETILANIWAPLSCCSTGDVPDREQFLKMAEADINFWVETARELNPSWFEWLTAVEETAALVTKKKMTTKK